MMMTIPNLSNSIQRKLIYDLSRRFGNTVSIYELNQNDYDLQTGKTINSFTIIRIRRVIVMTSKQIRIFAKNFDFGDAFDEKTRFFIFDRRFLKGFKPNLNCYVVFKNQRYKMQQINELENDRILKIKAKAIEGQLPFETHNLKLNNLITLKNNTNV